MVESAAEEPEKPHTLYWQRWEGGKWIKILFLGQNYFLGDRDNFCGDLSWTSTSFGRREVNFVRGTL